LTNLNGIENLTNLEELYCNDNKIENLNGIENLTNLEILYCQNNNLKNLNEIKKLNLRELKCNNNSKKVNTDARKWNLFSKINIKRKIKNQKIRIKNPFYNGEFEEER
jgi:Leucine-rich repeat (LRR) protein